MVVAVTTGELIPSGVAVHVVVLGATPEPVVPVTAVDGVGAFPTGQRVPAGSAVERVAAITTLELVATGPPITASLASPPETTSPPEPPSSCRHQRRP
jgi:hypothetical protein